MFYLEDLNVTTKFEEQKGNIYSIKLNIPVSAHNNEKYFGIPVKRIIESVKEIKFISELEFKKFEIARDLKEKPKKNRMWLIKKEWKINRRPVYRSPTLNKSSFEEYGLRFKRFSKKSGDWGSFKINIETKDNQKYQIIFNVDLYHKNGSKKETSDYKAVKAEVGPLLVQHGVITNITELDTFLCETTELTLRKKDIKYQFKKESSHHFSINADIPLRLDKYEANNGYSLKTWLEPFFKETSLKKDDFDKVSFELNNNDKSLKVWVLKKNWFHWRRPIKNKSVELTDFSFDELAFRLGRKSKHLNKSLQLKITLHHKTEGKFKLDLNYHFKRKSKIRENFQKDQNSSSEQGENPKNLTINNRYLQISIPLEYLKSEEKYGVLLQEILDEIVKNTDYSYEGLNKLSFEGKQGKIWVIQDEWKKSRSVITRRSKIAEYTSFKIEQIGFRFDRMQDESTHFKINLFKKESKDVIHTSVLLSGRLTNQYQIVYRSAENDPPLLTQTIEDKRLKQEKENKKSDDLAESEKKKWSVSIEKIEQKHYTLNVYLPQRKLSFEKRFGYRLRDIISDVEKKASINPLKISKIFIIHTNNSLWMIRGSWKKYRQVVDGVSDYKGKYYAFLGLRFKRGKTVTYSPESKIHTRVILKLDNNQSYLISIKVKFVTEIPDEKNASLHVPRKSNYLYASSEKQTAFSTQAKQFLHQKQYHNTLIGSLSAGS